MGRNALACCLYSTAVCLLLAVNTKALAEKQENVWIAKQVHEVLGDVTLYLGENRAKCVAKGGELTITCCAPNWNVVLYRQSDKLGKDTPFDKFSRRGLKILQPKATLSKGQAENSVYRPLNIKCRAIVRKQKNSKYYGVEDPTFFRTTKHKAIQETHYKSTQTVRLSKNVEKFVAGVYNVPIGGIPLELTYYFSDDSTNSPYRTTSLKKGSMPISFFTYPTGFKEGTLSNLLFSHGEKKKLEEYLDILLESETADRKTPLHK